MATSTADPAAAPGRTEAEPGQDEQAERWSDALLAATLIALDPAGLGGARLRAAHGPVREAWLAFLQARLPAGTPWRRLPLRIEDERLLGGLDLSATLAAGRPVAQRGLLAEADGGIVIAAMAERLSSATAARLCAALDRGEVRVERDGFAQRSPARFGLVALDESAHEDEAVPSSLCDRLAFDLRLDSIAPRMAQAPTDAPDAAEMSAARSRLAMLAIGDDMLAALVGTAMALGVDSPRAALLALRVARAAAALDGADEVEAEHASTAARLVLAPRATRLPAPPPADDNASDEPPPPPQEEPPPEPEAATPDDEPPPETEPPPDAPDDTPPPDQGPLPDQILEAALAALPADVLARLQLAAVSGASRGAGRAGALQASALRGRPAGARRGRPTAGARLDLIATLRSAAPWQPLRRREREQRHAAAGSIAPAPRLEIRLDDCHTRRHLERRETTTIFVLDASGSAALHRLAEAKGAIELLLADCYVRRDRVAVLAFRGRSAELLLPPTRSLVRAKRSLAGLPGGGGTPLAAGLDATLALADGVRRRGGTPIVVLLTDGRANIARDGRPGRAQAEQDALASARAWRGVQQTTLLVDTSPQPQPAAQALAAALGAVYLPLPHAGSQAISRAVSGAAGAAAAAAR